MGVLYELAKRSREGDGKHTFISVNKLPIGTFAKGDRLELRQYTELLKSQMTGPEPIKKRDRA